MKEERAGLVVEVKEDKQLDRVLDVVGSSEILDRDQEVIRADGWQLDNYRRNPVVLFAHNHREPPVAKALRVWAHDGQLRFKLQFPTMEEYGFADTLYKLYRGGYMNAVSVGFMPKRWEYGAKPGEPYRTFLEQELLELSLVPIPANPEALIQSRGLQSAIDNQVIDKAELAELRAIFGRMAERTESVEQGAENIEKEESRPRPGGALICEDCGEELACPHCTTKGEPDYIEELLRDLRPPGREPTGEAKEESDESELIEAVEALMKEVKHG